jgi:F-type H+-transporting ATPase subunit epsilon
MAAKALQFDLVTPERQLFSAQAELVVIPGVEGDFGVLTGHAPMVSLIRNGAIAVYEGDQLLDRFFVAGGFAEVGGERCTVLAEQALRLSEVNAEDVQKERDAAVKTLQHTHQPELIREAEATIARTEALLECLKV